MGYGRCFVFLVCFIWDQFYSLWGVQSMTSTNMDFLCQIKALHDFLHFLEWP